MPSNRRRHANAVPIALFATWGLIALFTLGGGLSYVWCKNQLYTTGTEIKSLERELAELKNKNEVSLSKVAQLSSTAKLQERFDSGFIKMVPITNDKIANIGPVVPKTIVSDLRPVSNPSSTE